jgi:hypothetical protein
VVLHVDPDEGTHGLRTRDDPGDVLATCRLVDRESHLRRLEADVPVEAAFGERVEGLDVGRRGGGRLLDRGDRLAEDVDGRRKAAGLQAGKNRQRLIQRLARDEAPNHVTSQWQAGREAAERPPPGERQEGAPQRPLGDGLQRRPAGHSFGGSSRTCVRRNVTIRL